MTVAAWSSPVGLGLFFVFCAGALALLSLAVWFVSRSSFVANRPARTRR